MFLCGRCNTPVDAESSDAIALRRWVPTRGALTLEYEWVAMNSVYFHVRCAPQQGMEWRLPDTA